MKVIGIIVLSIFGLFVLSGLLWGLGVATGIISLAPHVISNKVQMNHDIIDKTIDAETCLRMQDWFRTQEGSIETLRQTVDNDQQQIDDFNKRYPDSSKLSDTQQKDWQNLQDYYTGAKNELNDAINTYDAKSKQENLAYCKSGLPLFIHPF